MSLLLRNHDEASSDYKLDKRHKLKYVQNLFDGETTQFYRIYVLPSCITIGGAYEKIQNEFNSIRN